MSTRIPPPSSNGLAPCLRRNVRSSGGELFRNAPLVVVVLVYAAVVGVLVGVDAATLAARSLKIFGDLFPYALVSIFAIQTAVFIFVTKPASPIGRAVELAIASIRNASLGRLIARFMPIMLLAATFTAFKPTIPMHGGGFLWDETLLKLVRTVHFGYTPGQVLQPWLGRPWITKALDINYALWFGVMWTFVIGICAFCRDDVHRLRTLLAFVLSWIVVGSCLAMAFPSVGPCFYAKIVAGPDPFVRLMTYLRATHDSIGLFAIDAQDMLWKDYASGRDELGISAMPSMHNGVALLMVLSCWRLGLWLRLVMSTHAVLVFFGSIMLGWHYSIDGYIAWFAVAAIWIATEHMARWWTAFVASRALAGYALQPA